MHEEQKELYRAYLVRGWQAGDVALDQARPWRFAVEEVFGQRRRQGFGSLAGLLAFLEVQFTGEEGKPCDES